MFAARECRSPGRGRSSHPETGRPPDGCRWPTADAGLLAEAVARLLLSLSALESRWDSSRSSLRFSGRFSNSLTRVVPVPFADPHRSYTRSLERGQQGLQSGRPACLPLAPPVVVCQTQSAGSGNLTLPRQIPVRRAEIGSARTANAQLLVGEQVSPCPKAGCGKSVRPV